MTNDLQIFSFEGNEVRTITINDQPYFVGNDVATILGYKKPRNAIANHVDDEDKTTALIQGAGSNYKSKSVIINESGLYSLIISSKLPSAKKFKHWVTSEVLPSIRKHGTYMTPDKIDEILSDPDTIIKLATQLKVEREGRLVAEQRVNELTPKASYYDLVLQNKTLVTITQIAKDYGMSGQELNRKLHELGVIYRQGKTWLLYSKYQRTGWTQSETFMAPKADGTKKAVMHTKWTQKGRLGLYELLKQNGFLPLIELESED